VFTKINDHSYVPIGIGNVSTLVNEHF